MATRTPVLNTLKLDSSLCINCGTCIDVCPHGVFAPGPDAVVLVNADDCMECGACQRNCPTSAVTVDAGVGCASAMIRAAITGGEETCGDSCCGGGESRAQSCCGDSAPGKGDSCCGGASQADGHGKKQCCG